MPAMTLITDQLVLGISLLFFPRPWMQKAVTLLRGRRRKSGVERLRDPWKNARRPGDAAVRFGTEFSKVRNYLDLVRGAVGSLAIWGGLGHPAAIGGSGFRALGIKFLISLVAVGIQAARFRGRRVSFFPPVFFLGGLVFGFCGWQTAAFAFVLTWAMHAMIPSAGWFLTLNAVVVLGFGAFFQDIRNPTVAMTAGLIWFPVLLSLLTNRPLVIYQSRGGDK